MDFLDPRKRRAYTIRLIAGYILVGIAIALGAVILVYGAAGYGINTKNGDIVQNGLLFLDSKPGGANIFLNDLWQNSKTSARLVLPAGKYKIDLRKDGYRDWERSFTLDEHTIARFVYPFLVPAKPAAKQIKSYDLPPGFTTMSPDHRWLLLQSPPSGSGKITFEQFDTTIPSQPPKELDLATPVATIPNSDIGTLNEVEWSSDNKHLLLKHGYNGGSEFIVFNRDSPSESFNVNKLFKLDPAQAAFKNKKIDQLYLYNSTDSSLLVGDTSQGVVSPLLKRVLSFKPYGNNIVVYVTDQDMPAGQVSARIWDTTKSYPLYNFAAGAAYLIDAAPYRGHVYYIAGSDKADRINLYRDPLDSIKDPKLAKAAPLLSFRNPGANLVSFSATNARFVGIQAGQSFEVYDFETKDLYRYKFSEKLDTSLHWMDGHRWIGTTNGIIFVSDYDGTNRQQLLPTTLIGGGYFDKDYTHLFTLAGNQGKTDLDSVDMRAGADLPQP